MSPTIASKQAWWSFKAAEGMNGQASCWGLSQTQPGERPTREQRLTGQNWLTLATNEEETNTSSISQKDRCSQEETLCRQGTHHYLPLEE